MICKLDNSVAVPTGCATRCNSSVGRLESILYRSLAFRKIEVFSYLDEKRKSVERAYEAPLVECASRCATRGSLHRYGHDRLFAGETGEAIM
jgi:hypothetical protein